MHLVAPHEFRVPAAISIALPKGAALRSGTDGERLATIPEGETTRTFKVNLMAKLVEPIHVIVEARDNGVGARADRTVPEGAQALPIANTKVPRPPVGRPSGQAPAGR
jgi:hypothetical protein